MIHPNEPLPTPEWSLPARCRCDCTCASGGMTLDLWRRDPRRACGCCVGSCLRCSHGVTMPLGWDGDQV